jgi:hypothetical protein
MALRKCSALNTAIKLSADPISLRQALTARDPRPFFRFIATAPFLTNISSRNWLVWHCQR